MRTWTSKQEKRIKEFVKTPYRSMDHFMNPFTPITIKSLRLSPVKIVRSSFLSDRQHNQIQNFLMYPPKIEDKTVYNGISINLTRTTAYLRPLPDAEFCKAWNNHQPMSKQLEPHNIVSPYSRRPSITSTLDESRIKHSNNIIRNFQLLTGSGAKIHDHFYQLLSRQNRLNEDRDNYAKKIIYLQEIVNQLNSKQRAVVEAGLWLHDCGYMLDSGDSHPDESYQILANPFIQDALSLRSPVNFDQGDYDVIAMMGGYHGILGDSYPFAKIKKILSVYNRPFDYRALAIVAALDSSAKILPYREAGKPIFHSMMFSRTLDMIPIVFGCDLTKPDSQLNPFGTGFPYSQKWALRYSRLRSLLSHSNYCYLSDNGYMKLKTLWLNENLLCDSGSDLLLDRAFFKCWIFMKDLVTSKPEHETGYYIDKDSFSNSTLKNNNLLDFIALIIIFSKIMEALEKELGENGDVEIDLCDDIKREYEKNMEFRCQVLDAMRKILRSCSRETELNQYENKFVLCAYETGNIIPNYLFFHIDRNIQEPVAPIKILISFNESDKTAHRKHVHVVEVNTDRNSFPWYDPNEGNVIKSNIASELHVDEIRNLFLPETLNSEYLVFKPTVKSNDISALSNLNIQQSIIIILQQAHKHLVRSGIRASSIIQHS